MSQDIKKKVREPIHGLVLFGIYNFSKETVPKRVWNIYKEEVDDLNEV